MTDRSIWKHLQCIPLSFPARFSPHLVLKLPCLLAHSRSRCPGFYSNRYFTVKIPNSPAPYRSRIKRRADFYANFVVGKNSSLNSYGLLHITASSDYICLTVAVRTLQQQMNQIVNADITIAVLIKNIAVPAVHIVYITLFRFLSS